MSVNSELKKYGIEVIKPLDTIYINLIAKNIADKLCSTFPEYNFDCNQIFSQIARLNMYVAKIPNGVAEANYFYKNNSIYFSDNIEYEDIDIFAIHECIHYLQQIKDKKDNLIRLGLCEFSEFKIYGMALNEAAVQIASAKLKNYKKDSVRYYNINFNTISPTYYPILCNLVSQMAYLTGEDLLFNSVFFSNDDFKNKFIELTNETTFLRVCKNLDIILNTEEELIILNSKLEKLNTNIKIINKINNKINNKRKKITDTYFETQNIILTTYFEYEFQEISNKKEIEIFRNKLYNFKNLIGTNDQYTYYSEYYIEKMAKLEDLYKLFEFKSSKNGLVKIKTNKILSFFKKFKNLFDRTQEN